MSDTSHLTRIDRGVRAALAHEIGDQVAETTTLAELGVKPERFRMIAGLKILSQSARDAAVDPEAKRRLERIHTYVADRVRLEEQLAQVGVEPLAVLPSLAWQKICEQAKLFRFAPVGDRVQIDVRAIIERATLIVPEYIRHSMNNKRLLYTLFSVLVSIGLTCAMFVPALTESKDFLGGFSFFAIVLGGYFFRSVINDVVNPASLNKYIEENKQAEKLNLIRNAVIKLRKNGTLFSVLWPNFSEPINQYHTVAIALPNPPEHVQASLLAVERAGFKMHIAVAADAIAIKEDVGDIILNETVKRMDINEHLLAERDPIVYVMQGSAVAIIAQYGDFPIEQKVVEQVMNSIHLV